MYPHVIQLETRRLERERARHAIRHSTATPTRTRLAAAWRKRTS